MLLLFVVGLVAAYTNRNLIFEQRTAANQYRATQALEAADAGLEWALAMLNGGRIDADCKPSSDTSHNTFRDRYLSPTGADATAIELDGTFSPRVLSSPTSTQSHPMPTCVRDGSDGSWQCKCPSDEEASLPGVAGNAAKPMFRIRFELIATGTPRRDSVQLISAGCSRPDASCLADKPTAPAGDALAIVSTLVSMKSGLATPPIAAITARGAVALGTGPVSVFNTAPEAGGTTVHSGGNLSGSPVLRGVPGMPSSVTLSTGDPQLAGFSTGDLFFISTFTMAPAMHEIQPGLIKPSCAACTASEINAAAVANPGRVVWVNGGVTVDGDIGSVNQPVLLVATGPVTLAGGTVHGVIYCRHADASTSFWDWGSGNAKVYGALIAESGITSAGSQTVVYDPEIVKRVHRRIGSMVRIPGSWRDF